MQGPTANAKKSVNEGASQHEAESKDEATSQDVPTCPKMLHSAGDD